MCPKSKKVLLEHTRLVSRSVVNNLIASFFDRKRYKDHRIALTRIAQGNSIGLPIRDTAQ